jgi:hypothetical protein
VAEVRVGGVMSGAMDAAFPQDRKAIPLWCTGRGVRRDKIMISNPQNPAHANSIRFSIIFSPGKCAGTHPAERIINAKYSIIYRLTLREGLIKGGDDAVYSRQLATL